MRDDGVLILGSGSATHNLRDYFRPGGQMDYSDQFAEWLTKAVEAGNEDALADWTHAPGATRIHLGADGALRMDAFQWG